MAELRKISDEADEELGERRYLLAIPDHYCPMCGKLMEWRPYETLFLCQDAFAEIPCNTAVIVTTKSQAES